MLLAAVGLLIAATALLKVEASNAAETAFESSASDPVPAGVDLGSILSPFVLNVLVAVGGAAAMFSIYLAQRAWRGWSGSTAEPFGVALAALLAMSSGVVGVSLLAAMPASAG
ncbi:MAG TPA: hypothetical protein VFY69_06285 [Solirubrobacterales bacterium]|nr:hypothetical protein [Solirubrobacterales bacterium]